MTTCRSLTPSPDQIKVVMAELIGSSIARLSELASSRATARVLELAVWEAGLELCRSLLAFGLSARAAKATDDNIAERGISPQHVRVRSDAAYGAMKLMTTFGEVTFASYAYRDTSGPAVVTRSPARETVFALHGKCRSSELLIEWEARLAGLHPYRKAEGLLAYFTHGAVTNEDTTIQRHAIRIAHLIDQKWLYKDKAQILEVLRNHATVDTKTNRPIVYWSCDAHALRRYVNESWTPQWKMMNGLRVWCVDRKTQAIIHIGGEFTCGDAKYITERLRLLLEAEIMPANGDFGDGLMAQYVFVADGMPWLQQHLVPLLPGVIAITDAYHLIEYMAVVANAPGRPGTLSPKCWLKQQTDLIFGKADAREPIHVRRGHRKTKRAVTPRNAAVDVETKHSGRMLLELIANLPERCAGVQELRSYVEQNMDRMDYLSFRARGFQIGSGAMESFHRTGSQDRLKRPGAKWLPETLEGMFRLRMLELAGRWDEWWRSMPVSALAERFTTTSYRTRTGPEAAKPKRRSRATT